MSRLTAKLPVVMIGIGLIAAACGSGGGDEPATATAPTSSVAPSTSTTTSVAPTTTAPALEVEVIALGPEEIVFDWSEDRCDDEMRPDLPIRTFRTADGNVNMTLADPTNFRLVGPDFDSLVASCPAVRESNYDPDPSHYDHFQWFGATYTEDGSTIHAVIHNEFHGDEADGWLARRDFSLVQGERGWTYLARTGGDAFEMEIVDGEWRSSSLCIISDWGMHPDTNCDALRRWTAPQTGAVTVVARVTDGGQGGGNGVQAGIERLGEDLWSVTIDEGDTNTYETELKLDVSEGDELDFWVGSRGDAGWDATKYEIEINFGDDPCTDRGFGCQMISLTYAVSHDGGATWTSPSWPEHLVATAPVPYVPDTGLVAMWQPSDIMKHPTDGYYYMFVQYDFHRDGVNVQWDCLLRTATLDDPSSWRAWDGAGFEMDFPDPYTNPDLNPDDHTCPSVLAAPISGLSYNTYLERFVAIAGYGRIDPVGIYFLTSEDLINWTEPTLIAEAVWGWTNGNQTPYEAYPTLVDHSSDSLSFDTTGQFPYLYFSRFNSLSPRDYDLLRIPLRFDK